MGTAKAVPFFFASGETAVQQIPRTLSPRVARLRVAGNDKPYKVPELRTRTCTLAAAGGNLAVICHPYKLSLRMGFTRTQIAIAVGVGAVLVFGFLGYIWWLSDQGPVLARSEDHDPLTGLPVSIRMNPMRDRTIEHSANLFLRQLRDGHCDELLSKWEHDYRRKYAHFICDSEKQHPLLSWELAEWESAPPLTILHYHGKRQYGGGQPGTYQELFTVTAEKKNGEWVVTKYDAMY